MAFSSTTIDYKDTGAFAPIVTDYLLRSGTLKPFYNFFPELSGFESAIEARKNFPVNRAQLTETLSRRYKGFELPAKVSTNLSLLSRQTCFTICTAHQPNIFTGHLYFVYKILHAVKLAEELSKHFPKNEFVPVYYMGSEDADLNELGSIQLFGESYRWNTKQKGAVGRMKIDAEFLTLIDSIESRLGAEPHGIEIMKTVRDAYKFDATIEQATFDFVHRLFGEFGLLILLPDDHGLKKEFVPVFEKELNERFSAAAVAETAASLSKDYKLQATGRDINLFYLEGSTRERIEKIESGFRVVNTPLLFSPDEMKFELENFPERFSPNVVLRPLYQETILPNIAFIGGGGELAYWLELKAVFEAAGVFYPMLVLRNSFTVVEHRTGEATAKLGVTDSDLFSDPEKVLTKVVNGSRTVPDLDEELRLSDRLFETAARKAQAADPTLSKHVAALHKKNSDALQRLRNKIVRAEKRKLVSERNQLGKIFDAVKPGGILQERNDNILPYLAKYSHLFLQDVYKASLPYEQKFSILRWQE